MPSNSVLVRLHADLAIHPADDNSVLLWVRLNSGYGRTHVTVHPKTA